MKMTKIICENCKKECEKPTKEINRQIKQGRTKFYCSISCSTTNLLTKTEIIKSNCLFCGKEIKTTTHKKHKKCCNQICSTKYAQQFVDPDNHRLSVQREKTFPRNKNFECVVCSKIFSKKVNNNVDIKLTCSEECLSKLVSKRNSENPNCGGKLGYRRFKYNGFTMDSRWEVEIAKWMDSKKIKWYRSKKRYMFWWMDENNNKRKYFPDFYLPTLDVYLDPKNDYYLKRDLPKLKQVIDKYKIKLFYGQVDDIKKNIDGMMVV